MDRFPMQQIISRQRGPAPGAPGDGLAQGTPYTAVIRSTPVNGFVQVTIPVLHLSSSFSAHIRAGESPPLEAVCLVVFDEQKAPWVVARSWEDPTLTKLTAVEAKLAALEAGMGFTVQRFGTARLVFAGSSIAEATVSHGLGVIPKRVFLQPEQQAIVNTWPEYEVPISHFNSTTFLIFARNVKAESVASAEIEVFWQAVA